jgi:hypothetical protein
MPDAVLLCVKTLTDALDMHCKFFEHHIVVRCIITSDMPNLNEVDDQCRNQ